MSHFHKAYGLTFELPFECGLLQFADGVAGADARMALGPVPRSLPNAIARSDTWAQGCPWQAEPGRLLVLGGRRAGRFLVEGGNRITFERNPEGEDARIQHLLLHIVLAAVLKQRGFLVLHANAVVTEHGAVAISGGSGAGKSTTLAALHDRGCAVLSDDITALRLGVSGALEVLPGAPQVYLCEDAARGLGRDVAGLPRNPFRRFKAIVPTAPQNTPAPLKAIYLLEPAEGPALTVTRAAGAAKFAALQDCIYGPLLKEEHPGLFPLFANLAEQVPAFRIQRPAGVWTVDQVVETMLRA